MCACVLLTRLHTRVIILHALYVATQYIVARSLLSGLDVHAMTLCRCVLHAAAR